MNGARAMVFDAPHHGAFESGMHELQLPQHGHHLELPRDRMVIWVSAETWHCPFCEPDGGDGAGTTVTWLDGPHDGPDGRCGKCGVKLVLARAGEHVPDPLEQQQQGAPE